MKLTRDVWDRIRASLGTSAPEHGGVLGAGADGVISEYYFDRTGTSTVNGYSPDTEAINHMLIHDWHPRGIHMVGIIHSHSDNPVPSCGDIAYGVRILAALAPLSRFDLPIAVVRDGTISIHGYALQIVGKKQVTCEPQELQVLDT